MSPVAYEPMPVPPTLAPNVDEADQVPEEITATPVSADESMPVPPKAAPILEPFQVPWTTVPSSDLLVTIRLPPETVRPPVASNLAA